jgi:MarR family transcriptional regulator, temperature-dependent positive regulator of motility
VFEHCLYFNTSALSRLLERDWSLAFDEFGLTPPQAFLLRLVLDRPGLLQRELAEALSIARPTATRLLDGLEAKKLIERRASQSDGRESLIHPTKAAVNIRTALNAASGEVTKRLKSLLGRAHFESTVEHIKAVRMAMHSG